MRLLEWKVLCFDWNIVDVCSWVSHWFNPFPALMMINFYDALLVTVSILERRSLDYTFIPFSSTWNTQWLLRPHFWERKLCLILNLEIHNIGSCISYRILNYMLWILLSKVNSCKITTHAQPVTMAMRSHRQWCITVGIRTGMYRQFQGINFSHNLGQYRKSSVVWHMFSLWL